MHPECRAPKCVLFQCGIKYAGESEGTQTPKLVLSEKGTHLREGNSNPIWLIQKWQPSEVTGRKEDGGRSEVSEQTKFLRWSFNSFCWSFLRAHLCFFEVYGLSGVFKFLLQLLSSTDWKSHQYWDHHWRRFSYSWGFVKLQPIKTISWRLEKKKARRAKRGQSCSWETCHLSWPMGIIFSGFLVG